MKSQVIHLQTTPVFSQLLPLHLSSPPRPTRRRFRFFHRIHPLDGLESAPGTLPSALLRAVR